MHKLTKGSNKELNLHSQTVQIAAFQVIEKKQQFKKRKLRFRKSFGVKRSLGWIPFTNQSIQFDPETGFVTYLGREFKTFYHRKITGKIKTGSFSEDSKGNWFVNLTCEVAPKAHIHEVCVVCADPGLKHIAVLSDGTKIENPRVFKHLEEKLTSFQRHHKKKQAKNLSRKIKNIRLDFLHKASLKIAKKYKNIFVGNVSGKFLQKTNGKSSADASIGLFRNMLEYKAIAHSGNYYEVNEKFSTLTCGACAERTGPQGLMELKVREWNCSKCFAVHDRDINAANNILAKGQRDTLRFGHETLIQTTLQ